MDILEPPANEFNFVPTRLSAICAALCNSSQGHAAISYVHFLKLPQWRMRTYTQLFFSRFFFFFFFGATYRLDVIDMPGNAALQECRPHVQK